MSAFHAGLQQCPGSQAVHRIERGKVAVLFFALQVDNHVPCFLRHAAISCRQSSWARKGPHAELGYAAMLRHAANFDHSPDWHIRGLRKVFLCLRTGSSQVYRRRGLQETQATHCVGRSTYEDFNMPTCQRLHAPCCCLGQRSL